MDKLKYRLTFQEALDSMFTEMGYAICNNKRVGSLRHLLIYEGKNKDLGAALLLIGTTPETTAVGNSLSTKIEAYFLQMAPEQATQLDQVIEKTVQAIQPI